MIYQDWDLELEGEHIRIAPLTEADREPYGRLVLGELYSVIRELGQEPATGMNEALNRTAKEEIHAIRPLTGEAFIGWIALQRNEEGLPDIGISLVPEEQNRGFGPEAVQLYGNYLFREYGLQRLSVRISAGNKQSQNAFGKVGAVFEKEIIDPRYASLHAEGPELPDYGDMMKLRYYHIPLPIGQIRKNASSRPDEASRKQAQEAYAAAERQLTKRQQLAELKFIREKIRSMGNDVSTEEVQNMLEERLAGLKGQRQSLRH